MPRVSHDLPQRPTGTRITRGFAICPIDGSLIYDPFHTSWSSGLYEGSSNRFARPRVDIRKKHRRRTRERGHEKTFTPCDLFTRLEILESSTATICNFRNGISLEDDDTGKGAPGAWSSTPESGIP